MKKEKKERLPIGRIISDNLYVLRLIRKAAPGLMISYVLLTLFSSLASFFSNTYLLRHAINGMSEGKSFKEIVTLAILFLIVNLSVDVASNVLNHGYLKVKGIEGVKAINAMVYKKAASAELACYENPEFYNDFQKVIDDTEQRTNAVINSVLKAVHQIVTFSANFGLLIAIDPILLIFVTVPILLSPLRAISNKLGFKRTMDTKEVNRRRNYSRRVFYLEDYAKEMRLTNMPALMLKRFREAGEENLKILKKYGFKIGTVTYLLEEMKELFCCMAANVYALWKTVGLKSMLLGDCVIVINSIGQIAWTLADTASVMLNFQENALYIENLRKFMDYEPKLLSGDKPLPKEGDLVLENVSFRYDGAEKYTLKNVSMRIGKNEKIAIVGHNGAGKTTLTKLLLRLYDCEGSITYGGVDIKELRLDEYRDAFSAVMQDYHVFALSVADNVYLREREKTDSEMVENALKQSGIYEKISSLPDGIETVLTREFDVDGVQLSGGEQQKLAISHVYSKQNRFVILDEPSSALDPIAEYEMYERMNAACKDCGMIFISHRLSSAVLADRVYLMEHGQVLEEGTHESLMRKNGRYAEMFRRQAENYAGGDGMRVGRPMGNRGPRFMHEEFKNKKISRRSVIKNNFWMLRRIFNYTPLYVVLMAIEGVLLGINNAVEVIYTKKLLDSLTNGSTFADIMRVILIYTIYRTIYYAWNQWYWQVFVPYSHERMHIALHSEMFSHAVTLDLDRYDDPEFYNDFIWSMDRAYERAVQLMQDTGIMIGRIVSTIAVAGVMYTVDPWMAVLALLLASLRVLFAFLRNRKNLKYWHEMNILYRKDGYIKRVFMLPDYAKELRATRVSENLNTEYDANIEKQKGLVRKYQKPFTIISTLLSASWLVGEMGMFIYVLYKVMVTGEVEIGAFAVAINGLWKLTIILRDFVDRVLRYHEHGIFIEKVIKFRECRPRILSGEKKAENFESLEIKNLTFSYGEDTEKSALSNVSIKINKGERIAIVGYNGAGKTTLTKLMLRLYDAKEGCVLYNGNDIKEYNIDSLRERVAAVFQDYRIFASTLSENVAGGECSEEREDAVKSALLKSSFGNKLESLADGLNTPLTREFYDNGTVLSGGEQQKVAIARAFYKNADLIILDEPSSALDPDAEYELNKAISDYADDKTVVFISHRLSTTRHADRIYMFDGGRLVESGTHEELIAQNGKYAYMFNLQAENYRKQAK